MSTEEQKQWNVFALVISFPQVGALEQKLVLVLKLDFPITCLSFDLWMMVPYFQLQVEKNKQQQEQKHPAKETPALQALS